MTKSNPYKKMDLAQLNAAARELNPKDPDDRQQLALMQRVVDRRRTKAKQGLGAGDLIAEVRATRRRAKRNGRPQKKKPQPADASGAGPKSSNHKGMPEPRGGRTGRIKVVGSLKEAGLAA